MKQSVDVHDFIDAFRAYDRMDQFSYSGLKAIFDYFEQLEDDTGEEIELDVIAICCDFAEYDNAAAIAAEYDRDFDGDEDEQEEKALNWLYENTTVIEHDDGIIIQSF